MFSDWEYGPHDYRNIKFLDSWINEGFLNERNRIENLFNHIYFPVKVKVDTTDGYKYEVEWYDAGLTYNKILADFKSKYRKRLVFAPYYFCNEDGNEESKAALKDKISMVLDLNIQKYRKLVELAGLYYEPLSNTSIKNNHTDTLTHEGKEKLEHSIDADELSYLEISGPLKMSGDTATTANLTTNPKETPSLTLVFDADPKIKTDRGTATQNRKGANASLNDQKASLTENDSQTVKTASYSGPYNGTNAPDDSNDSVLDNVIVEKGTVGEAVNESESTDVKTNGKASFGNPSAYSYTDTKTFSDDNGVNPRKDIHTIDGSEEGYRNLDVSDIIEKQRKLVEFSVVNEFFKDLSKEILLSLWG